MNTSEREKIKVAKAMHKEALKNRVLYNQRRDELLMCIIESPIPKWGGISVKISAI